MKPNKTIREMDSHKLLKAFESEGDFKMKQRITVSQLQELTQEQQDYLRLWWSERQQQGDVFICLGNDFLNGKQFAWDGHNKPFNMSIPLLNIGQMIEILLGCSCINCALKMLDERIRNKIYGNYGMEFCDALWEVTKEYLRIH